MFFASSLSSPMRMRASVRCIRWARPMHMFRKVSCLRVSVSAGLWKRVALAQWETRTKSPPDRELDLTGSVTGEREHEKDVRTHCVACALMVLAIGFANV